MLRVALGVLIAVLAAAPPAAGAPIALRDDLGATAVALAGDEVLVLRDRRRGAELIAVPRAGGAARTLLSVRAARPTWPNEYSLAASDERVALFLEIADERDRTVEWRVYSGPPSGPLEIVRRTRERESGTWVPYVLDVDGDRVLLIEVDEGDDDGVRARVYDPVSGFVPIEWSNESIAPVAIAGRHAAAIATRPRRLAIVDLLTGAPEAVVRVPRFTYEYGVDLAAGGRLVAATRAGLLTMRPGEAAQTVPGTEGLSSPRFGADAIAAFQGGRPVVLGADGSREVLDPPSSVPTGLAADARGVAWLANGCLRHSALAAPFPGQADDPCPSTEIALAYIASSPLRGRHVRVPVRCVTAPTGICRGTVLGKVGRKVVARGRLAIPTGAVRRVRMRVTRAAAARFRRDDFGSLIIDARIPDGRIGVGADGSSELTVKVR
jgi:hypothetical protein